MQTFAPEGTDIDLGFYRLDYRRLGKQRVEAWQILNVLRGVDNEGNPKEHKGWVNHPATRMWEGHIAALARYGFLTWCHLCKLLSKLLVIPYAPAFLCDQRSL